MSNLETPVKIDGTVGEKLDITGLLQDVKGAIADQTQVLANTIADEKPSAPKTQFMATPSQPQSSFWSSGKSNRKKGNNPYHNTSFSMGNRRNSTASDGAGMEIILEVLQVLEDASSSFFTKRKAGKGNASNKPASKMMGPKKNQNKSSSLMNGVSANALTPGAKKSGSSAQDLAEAKLEALLELQGRLLRAQDKKYFPLSNEQKQRIEDGLSTIRSDLYQELGRGGQNAERLFKHLSDDVHKPSAQQSAPSM